MGLFRKFLQSFPFCLLDFGTDLDASHEETVSSDVMTCQDKDVNEVCSSQGELYDIPS